MWKTIFNRKNWLVTFCCILFYAWLRERMMAMEIRGYENLIIGFGLKCGILLAGLSILYFFSQFNKTKVFGPGRYFLIFTVYFNLISIIYASFSNDVNMSSLVVGLFSFFLFYLSYSLTLKVSENYHTTLYYSMCLVTLLIFYDFYNSVSLLRNIVSDDYLSNSSSYYVLYLAPFTLCTKNKWIRIIFITLVGIAMLMSGKRSGFIAYVLMLSVYYFVDYIFIKSRKINFTKIIAIILVLITLLFILLLYMQSNGSTLLERFASIKEDKGSGRIPIWIDTIDLILNSNLPQLFLGHGYNAVFEHLKISSHNDILEVLFDYGIIGLILFIKFMHGFFLLTKQMIKNKFPYTPAMIASLIIFSINIMFSHIVIYFDYFAIFAFFWGYNIALYYRYIKVNQMKK